MMIVATIIVTIGFAALWFSPVISTVNQGQLNITTYAQIQPEIKNTMENYKMHAVTNNSFSVTRNNMNITFIQTGLMENETNNTGFTVTVLVNNHVSGSIMEITRRVDNNYNYTLIPFYSTILKSTKSFELNTTVASRSNRSYVNSIVSNDVQYFPTGTYSTGFAGWAYSWSQYQLEGLLFILGGGQGVSDLVMAMASAGIATAIAVIMAPLLLASIGVIGYIDWMGGYQGVYYAYSTNWMAALYGHPPTWIAYNPVPGGY
ncbi:MAG: hypothetical protein M1529_00285 [Candidatus Thermoplasmatota archaeon]|nr:hypothetical protein [Candidatus Thermoplasmatota archaeon]